MYFVTLLIAIVGIVYLLSGFWGAMWVLFALRVAAIVVSLVIVVGLYLAFRSMKKANNEKSSS